MASAGKQRCLRSSFTSDEIDTNLGFKPLQRFPNEKLPSKAEVIGYGVHMLDTVWNINYDTVIHSTATALRNHWIERNVYPISLKVVKTRVKKLFVDFRNLKKVGADKRNESWKNKVRNFVSDKNELYDIFCENKIQRQALEKEHGIPMEQKEWDFLQAMRTDRHKGACKGIDKQWHKEQDAKERKSMKRKELQYGTTTTCTSTSNADVEDECDVESDDEVFPDEQFDEEVNETIPGPSSNSKRRSFTNILSNASCSQIQTRNTSKDVDQSPKQLNPMSDELHKYVRLSARHVRDEIYQTCAELSGFGFSYYEIQIALSVVANRLFGCSWQIPPESRGHEEFTEDEPVEEQQFDNNTLPTRKAMRSMLERIEAQSLNLIAQKLVDTNNTDDVVTHATDSTTRKKVGCFAPQGVHINKDQYLPLSTLDMGSETNDNVSESVVTGFKILEAASNYTKDDLYSCVDLHMTDSTSHNKGVAANVAERMEREIPAGQLFCNVHTSLGFDACLKKVINEVEQKMDMSALAKCFVLDININQKSDTVSLSVIDWILNLFGPDLVQKPWNYHNDFKIMLERKAKMMHLFHLKDGRFGLLSMCCAVCIFHWHDFEEFLDSHNYITNKLACLVRDGMEHDYVKVIACVCAAFGIHLVIPFHYKTKGNSDHSTLQQYFVQLYDNLMSTPVTPTFFEFSTPAFTVISQRMFDGVKSECGVDVLEAVTSCAHDYIEECVLLANKMTPELAEKLSMQRGKYYEFGTHETEYPVFQQAANVDKSITHNLQQERECGDHDHRLVKKCNINTVSRDNILKKTTKLRDESTESFRACAAKVLAIKRVKKEWNERQAKMREAGLSKKETEQLKKENTKMKILEELKKEGGPFTNADEIEQYMAREDISETAKQKRMKNEVKYARDTTRSIPAAGILFRIMKKDSVTQKQITMAADEFAENLKIVLGKKESRGEVSMDDFLLALWG